MPDKDVPEPGPSELGQSFGALIGGGAWEVDDAYALSRAEQEPASPNGTDESPPVEAAPASGTPAVSDEQSATPPTLEQIVEAMLFAGGPPLQPDRACEVVRGATPEQFQECIENLNRRYRSQMRPYLIARSDAGYTLTVLASYRSLRQKLFGGPRETRLSQPALDVLAVVAYRQPATRAEIDSLRGIDSASLLRQLVRLGLLAVTHRGGSGQADVCYGTTPRFLEVFRLRSLDELPKAGDPQRL